MKPVDTTPALALLISPGFIVLGVRVFDGGNTKSVLAAVLVGVFGFFLSLWAVWRKVEDRAE